MNGDGGEREQEKGNQAGRRDRLQGGGMNAKPTITPLQLPEDPVARLEAVCRQILGRGWRNKAGPKLGVSKATVYNWADRTYAPPDNLDEMLLGLVLGEQEAVAERAGEKLSKLASTAAALRKRAKSGREP
jgi:hypothetical protein